MKVAVIGAGLIGSRRAAVARAYGDSVTFIRDTDNEKAAELAERCGARTTDSLEEAVEGAEIVAVSTPNKYLLPAAELAMNMGRHVLIEKPMGRNHQEAARMLEIQQKSGVVLKVGFNHRYHPAISKAKALIDEGCIGELSHIRSVYGHGGRPGYENEWRGDRDLAGGGELTDQGVHLIDLICWMASQPDWTFSQRRTSAWPLGELEDNGFITLGWNSGAVAQLHTSWTQWKNRFSLQLYGSDGALEIEGIGGSYGEETLTIYKRNHAGGIPEIEKEAFPGEDRSWEMEWQDFRSAIDSSSQPMSSAGESVRVMKILEAIYKSCETDSREPINWQE